MSVLTRPPIVTNGLVLHLDAANRKSYPGTGTTWFDMSGNNNSGSLVNGPTYNSLNGGSIAFDGVNDYVSTSLLGSYGSGMATNGVTIDFVISTTYTASLCQFGTLNTGLNTILVVNFNRDANDVYAAKKTTLSIRGDGGTYLIGEMNSDIYTGNYFYVSITRVANTNALSFYVNGVSQTVSYGSNTGNPSTFSNFEYPFMIGAANSRGTAASFLNCNVPTFKLYNRALSAQEVLQNYNATKARFGL